MDNIPGLPSGFTFGPAFFLSVIFGLIGTVYFMYGKKEQKATPMLVGVAMGVYPYFIKSVFGIILVGVLLMAVPVYFKD